MIMLKVPLRRYRTKCSRKFEIVRATEIHCFRRHRPVRFAIHSALFHKRRQRICGYAVTELTTFSRISGGRTTRDAIRNTRAKLDEKNVGAKGLLRGIKRAAAQIRSRAGRKKFATP